ncbi:acylphosphatase [Leptospira santarosai]|uniref:acylphosphatase n=1 Tax=Leptospira santarosai TaxID=28183 RepID=UPI000248A144|nr:acylphosphatase [Leptospira santarosai]EMM75368.1 acylphosphatase [Leptospira santarosai str. 2000030832]MDI7205926.1 acylphosphatase [Leptospira santarosai]MDI7205985.1 acylphosphatase [Leptospira santarosai]
MGSKNNSRAKILVRGKVQGVGFRYYILQRAQEGRLSGYTQNLPGGEVETVVEGDKVFIEDLYKAIQRGPKGSEVKEVLISWEDPKGNFRTFEIKK